jgi:DNA-binding MarR family transcriptional regulator
VKEVIKQLDKAFENRIRLGIMSVLMTEESITFNDLKSALELTDGNLASHLKALEKKQYVEVEKKFVGRKPNTTYRATKMGKKAFRNHLEALEKLIAGNH